MKKILPLLVIISVAIFSDVGTDLKVCPYSIVNADALAFELKGFANVDFEVVGGPDRSDKEHKYGSFILSGMDLYISEVINDRLDILGEILFEQEEEMVEVERFHVGYIFDDSIKVRVGRFHTPLGFWNISYHHGAQLQPTIDRPEILKFEDDGGVIPAHTIGIDATGRFKAGSSVFIYDLMVGNGDKITKEEDGGSPVLSPNVSSDNNSNKSIAFSLSVKSGIIQNLKVGISGNYQLVQSEGSITPSVDVLQTIIVPAFLYNIYGFDIWGEYFYIKNDDKSGMGEDKTNNGYYILLTYTLDEHWMPYILTESRDVENGDRYIQALGSGDLNETIIGIKYNTNYRSCIKAEGRLVEEGEDKYNEYAIQWALSF